MAVKKWSALVGACVWLGGSLGPSSAEAGKWFWHHARTFNQGGIGRYNYQPDASRRAATVIAIASIDQPTAITRYVRELDGTRRGVRAQRKNFFVPVTGLEVDNVQLKRLGIALYDSGRYACTGLLEFDGGEDAALRGANVVVRVRAYSGAPQHPGDLNNMRLLWETERAYWVPRQSPLTASLLPTAKSKTCRCRTIGVKGHLEDSWPRTPSDLILQHFDEITHMEVTLEYHRDR